MENKGTNLTPEQALDRLEELYEQSVNALREAIADYVDNGTLPDPHARLNGLFVYPSLSVSWDGATPNRLKHALLDALLIPAVIPLPLRGLRYFALIFWNSLTSFTMIMARILR
ncbi:AMP nucleosidase [Salmonella enterica subsp. enterica]|nr:AMP nucleosidase [Salmonella enterica subsp. enterica]